jgi:hypothetical protein
MNQQTDTTENNTTKKYTYADALEAKNEAMQAVSEKIGDAAPSFLPGIISALTTDTAGAINRLSPSLGTTEGDPTLYGPIDYFRTTFADPREGEMVISLDQLEANPQFKEYMINMSQMMKGNALMGIKELAEGKGLKNREELDGYVFDLHAKFASGDELTDDENAFVTQFFKLQEQAINPFPYRMSEDGQSIIIRDDFLPSVAMEPDPKFTEQGYLSLPYAGVYSVKDGILGLEAPSMFRFTDEMTRGKDGPAWLEATEDYLYPNLSPNWSYGETPEETLGYQVGQVAPGVSGLVSLAKGAYRQAKKIPQLFKGKPTEFEGIESLVADPIKIEPFLE